MTPRTGRHAHSLSRIAALGATAALLPMLSGPVAAATPLFEPFQAYAVGSWPEAVAIGDVNGDGRADVVLTTSYYFDPTNDYRLFVFTQTPDGRLNAPVSYATAATYQNRPKSASVADVTGDGRADVVLGLSGLGIQVFPQTTAGALGTPLPLIETADSDQVRVGRLNGDDALDLAGVGWGTNTVSVFLNDGQGVFAGPTAYNAIHGGYDDLEIADVTGDGRDDLVVMSGQLYTDPNVSVLAQLAAGGFGLAAPYTIGNQLLTSGIGVGDVTGDGRNDVVASYGGNRPTAALAVFGQTAGGSLSAPTSYPSYDCPEPVAVSDVDGDGRADVVTLHGGWNRVGVYRSQPGGTLATEELYVIPYATHYGPGGLAVGDFTGDGRPDVAIADYNQGLVVLRSVAAPPPVPPSAPQSLATSPNLSAGVGLTWAAPSSAGSSPISGYRVYRGTASGAETALVTLGKVLTYTDTAAANGTTYWYQVAAISAAGESPRSAEAIAARGTAPGAPLAPSAAASKTSIAVRWSAPATTGGSPITGYRVYRGTAPGAETLLVGVSVSKTSYTDASVSRKTRYYYRVSATNALGESVLSAEVSATTK